MRAAGRVPDVLLWNSAHAHVAILEFMNVSHFDVVPFVHTRPTRFSSCDEQGSVCCDKAAVGASRCPKSSDNHVAL